MDCPPCYMVQLGTDLYCRPDHVSRVYKCGGKVHVGVTSGQAFVTDWPIYDVLDALDLCTQWPPPSPPWPPPSPPEGQKND